MATSLLQTKLNIPPVRPELVWRPRLIERLNAGLHRKLSLVSAPAGFGKTTLLSEWIHHGRTRLVLARLSPWVYNIGATNTTTPERSRSEAPPPQHNPTATVTLSRPVIPAPQSGGIETTAAGHDL